MLVAYDLSTERRRGKGTLQGMGIVFLRDGGRDERKIEEGIKGGERR